MKATASLVPTRREGVRGAAGFRVHVRVHRPRHPRLRDDEPPRPIASPVSHGPHAVSTRPPPTGSSQRRTRVTDVRGLRGVGTTRTNWDAVVWRWAGARDVAHVSGCRARNGWSCAALAGRGGQARRAVASPRAPLTLAAALRRLADAPPTPPPTTSSSTTGTGWPAWAAR